VRRKRRAARKVSGKAAAVVAGVKAIALAKEKSTITEDVQAIESYVEKRRNLFANITEQDRPLSRVQHGERGSVRKRCASDKPMRVSKVSRVSRVGRVSMVSRVSRVSRVAAG
jgi:hypothetical protein